MQAIRDGFIRGDFSNLQDLVVDDCIDHTNNLNGLAAMKNEYAKWAKIANNTRTSVITEMANDDYVISWVSFDITAKTEVDNKKPGHQFEKTDIEVAKFQNGKVIEYLTFIEPKEMEKILQPKTASDSVK